MQGNFARLSEIRGGAHARGAAEFYKVDIDRIPDVAGALVIGSVCVPSFFSTLLVAYVDLWIKYPRSVFARTTRVLLRTLAPTAQR
jgi:hypothetical protein